MPQTRSYPHLSAEARAVIVIERQNGASMRSVAGRSYRQRRQRSRRRRLLAEGTPLDQHLYDHLVFLRGSP